MATDTTPGAADTIFLMWYRQLMAFLLVTAVAQAQAVEQGPRYVVERWTTQDGLPINSLNQVLQTRDGYLWIATFDGLVRFDGARFVVFEASLHPALGSNRAIDLHESRDGTLWIVTEEGNLVARRDDGNFELSYQRTRLEISLHEGRHGTLWLIDDGRLLRRHGDDWIAEPLVNSLPNGKIEGVHVDQVGRLWIGASTGIGRLHADGKTWRWWSLRDIFRGQQLVASPHLLHGIRFEEAEDAKLWVGGFGSEGQDPLYWTCSWSEETIRCLRESLYPQASGNGIWLRSLPPTLHRVRDGRYERLIDGPSSVLWWLSHGPLVRPGNDGITWVLNPQALYRDDGKTFREVFRVPAQGPNVQTLTSFDLDHEGTIWITTDTAGLIALKPARVQTLSEAEGLGHRILYALFEDREDHLWAGGRGDWLSRIAPDGEVTTWRDLDFNDTALTFHQEANGDLLLGAISGLYRFDAGRLEALDTKHVAVRAILRRADGVLLIAMGHGLFEHPPGPLSSQSFARQMTQVRDFPSQEIQVMHQARDGALWYGTSGDGLVREKPVGSFMVIDAARGLSSDQVRAIHEDDSGRLWLGTSGGGLNRLDPASLDRGDKPEIIRLEKHHGLFDNSIHQILADDAGWLWMSTNRGIFRVQRDALEAFARGEIQRVESVAYTESDGMRHREANGGVQEAGLRARDGRLWFPTMDGLAIFDPEALTVRQEPPPVRIERLIAENTAYPADLGRITLAPEERSFEIESTVLSFRAPDLVRFRYFLEGYDENWHDAGPRRLAAYTKVPPGDYVFRVRGRSGDGVWNQAGARLDIKIHPFLWETWWFRGLCGLALFAAVLLGIRQRDHNLRAQRRHLEEVVTTRTAQLREEKEKVTRQTAKITEHGRLKSELFANISHELRTPLTLILGPLSDLRQGRYTSEEGARQVELAHANATRMLKLVEQLLDASKLEAGRFELRVRPGGLNVFVKRLVDRFLPLAERQRCELLTITADAEIEIFFDPEELDKVFSNLLSNALKLTPPGGRIEVRVGSEEEARPGWVNVAVRDTGPGMDPSERERIFDRFYQVESSTLRHFPGTGLGLALARDLVQLHRGELDVESAPGEGSTFRVRLRLGAKHFARDQIAEPDADPVPTPSSDGANAPATDWIESEPLDEVNATAQAAPKQGVRDDRITVLIIDDHPDLRAYVRSHLEARYQVIEAYDGASGLARAREHPPDLLVSDVMMPEMDGFELCRELRRDPELDWIPLILLTAKATAEAKLEGLGVGADDYLTKPFDAAELLARVDNLIASRRRLRKRFRAEGVWGQGEIRLPISEPPKASPESELLERVAKAIDTALADESFGIEELARHVGLGRTQLYTRLKELTGKTPAQILMERRLEAGAKLLAGRAGRVSEVAYAVGFKSAAHFSRQFHKAFGMAPSVYQNQAT